MGLFKDCGCGCKGKKQEQKFLISVMSALVFFIIANPDTFRLMRKILGSWVSSPTGCPTSKGLILHTLVFLLVTWGMMNIKREEFEVEEPSPSPEEPVEPVEVEGPSPGPSAPPAMVDMPLPLPGMEEEQFAFIDSGLELGSMDLTTETDLPAVGEYETTGEAVTCSCSDGKKVVITP